MTPHVAGILYASIASLAWAVFSFLIKMALRDAPVLKITATVTTLNAAYVTVATLFLVPTAGFAAPAWETLGIVLLAGALHIGVSRSFFYASIQRIGPNRSVPLAMSYPVVTALLAAAFLNEPVTLRIFAGLAVLLGGITLIVRAAPAQGADVRHDNPRGRLIGFTQAAVAAFLWGLAAVFFKKSSLELNPMIVSTIALWTGSAVAWIIWAGSLRSEGHARIPRSAWVWLLLAAACQATAVPFYNLAFTKALAVQVTAIISAQPLFAIGIGWIFMRESENITGRLIAGAVLTMVGTLVVVT